MAKGEMPWKNAVDNPDYDEYDDGFNDGIACHEAVLADFIRRLKAEINTAYNRGFENGLKAQKNSEGEAEDEIGFVPLESSSTLRPTV